jgi:EmrB/QacA subfamily drug resistance transporter
VPELRDRIDRSAPPPAAAWAAARWALAGLALCMLLAALGTSSANVVLPTLATDLDAPFADVQWVVLAYLLGVTSLVVGAGRLGDLAGRRRLLLAGVGLFAAASILCGVAPTLGVLVAARALQGVGAAALMALSIALVVETVPRERTGSAMGLLGTTSAVGPALGPSLGGLLTGALGWRALFLVNVPLAVAALVLLRRHLPLDHPVPRADRPRFDVLGTVLLAGTLGAYALAMTLGRGHLGPVNAVLLVAVGVGIAAFVVAERRAATPLIRLSALRDAVLARGLAMSGLVATVMMATLVVGPFYLTRSLGLDVARTGLVLSVGPLVAALAGVPGGRVVDRIGAGRATVAGLCGMVGGLLLLIALPRTTGVAGYVVPLAVVTAGYALFQAANTTAVMAGVASDRRGVTSGLLNLSRNLGLVTGASAMAVVFAAATASSDVAVASGAAVATGMRVTYAVAALLVLAALGLALARRARR